MRTHRSGFTMIELVIVVLILGILGAVAAPRYLDTLANYRANAMTRRIVTDLRIAKRRAQQTSTTQTVAFHVLDNRYVIAEMDDLDRASKVYENRLGEVIDQARLIYANFGESSTLVFDIYGQPSIAGMIVFNAGGRDLVIQVEESGQIHAPTHADIAALEQGL